MLVFRGVLFQKNDETRKNPTFIQNIWRKTGIGMDLAINDAHGCLTMFNESTIWRIPIFCWGSKKTSYSCRCWRHITSLPELGFVLRHGEQVIAGGCSQQHSAWWSIHANPNIKSIAHLGIGDRSLEVARMGLEWFGSLRKKRTNF